MGHYYYIYSKDSGDSLALQMDSIKKAKAYILGSQDGYKLRLARNKKDIPQHITTLLSLDGKISARDGENFHKLHSGWKFRNDTSEADNWSKIIGLRGNGKYGGFIG